MVFILSRVLSLDLNWMIQYEHTHSIVLSQMLLQEALKLLLIVNLKFDFVDGDDNNDNQYSFIIRYLKHLGLLQILSIGRITSFEMRAKHSYENALFIQDEWKVSDRILVKAGADIEIRDKYVSTPLLIASRKGFTVVVHMLLKAGADIEAKNKRGYTPLMIAMTHLLVL